MQLIRSFVLAEGHERIVFDCIFALLTCGGCDIAERKAAVTP